VIFCSAKAFRRISPAALLTVPVNSDDAVSGMHTEATVMPAHELLDELVG
jgi:hypothetical protein